MRRHRQLLVNEMSDPGFSRLRHQCLAERFERFTLMSVQQAERHTARFGFSRRH